MLRASVLLLLGMLSFSAFANTTYTCSYNDQERIIDVVYENESGLPCKVNYTKADTTETLWSANHTAGYCDEKAIAFVEQQKDWGWTCTAK